ncbi:hypothetical protein [Helicobacter sp.]|uniref:hypothetical protein n=1 Tax=Helicobacter sp. TaxID=218 RepID=UPI0019C8E9C5|nr:hypothetical protein [Helicobacter sp.]MBD5165442.1 hypothetical protein [Helicobacter sp.]
MRYFIYPRGGHGRTLGEMLKFLDSNIEICFIDDSYAEISLESCKNEILSSGDKVLLALEQKNPYSRVIMQQLIKNLKESKITNYQKSVLYYSTRIVGIAKQETLRRGWKVKNTIAIGVYNLGGEKHLGFIDEALKNHGFHILYLCSNDVSYHKCRKKDSDNSLAIPLVVEHFDLVDFVWALYMTTPCNFKNPKVKYFYQPHGIADCLENILRFGGIEETMEIVRHADYIVVPTRLEAEILKKSLEYYCLDKELIEGGYPAFEVVNKEIINNKNLTRDSVLIAMHDESDLSDIQEGVKLLLENSIKVIFRPGYGWRKQAIDEFSARFSSNPCFSIDEGEKISADSYNKSFCAVVSASSVGYTFPLTTFCKAILYFEDKSIIDSNCLGYRYFNPILHDYAYNPQSLLQAVERARDLQVKYQSIIQEYKIQQVFHLGNASEVIAKKIKAIHKAIY